MNPTSPYILDTDAPGKARILDAALRLFAQNGLSATSIRDIAKAADLSNPALYKHFKTKEEVAIVLFKRLYQFHFSNLRHDVERAIGYRAKLSAFLENRLRVYDEHPNATVFATDNLSTLWPHMPNEMKQRTILSLLRDIINLGRSERAVANDTDIAMQIALVTGILEQVTRQKVFGGLSGTSLSHLDDVERLLHKALV